MSFRKKHIKNKIYKSRPQKSVLKRWWFWILILFFAIVFLVTYFLFFYSGFQIKNIVILGNDIIKNEELQSVVLNSSSKSIFLVDINKIEKEILRKLPTAESATLNKKLPKTLVLSISERKPIGAFCNSFTCFWIDKTGNIFSPLPAQETNTLIIRDAVSARELFVGDTVLNQDIVSKIIKIEKNLKDNFNIKIEEVLIATLTKLDVKTDEEWKIYFDISQGANIADQLTKINLLLGNEISRENRKQLRYINLIPKDRAIICDNAICRE